MSNQEQLGIKKIRVLLAEDHHIVRDALRKRLLVEANMDVVGEVSDGSNLCEVTRDTQPDLVLMDADMPQHDPDEAIVRLHEMKPGLKVIILSMHDSPRYVVGAFQAGVDGYVLKDDPADALFQAIHSVMNGRRWVSPRLGPVLATFVQDGDSPPPDLLTEREQEVLVVLAKGYRNEKIGEVLTISENTVRNHVASIFQKLGVETRVEAVVFALSQELISLDEIALKHNAD